jgi:hypothetical protein
MGLKSFSSINFVPLVAYKLIIPLWHKIQKIKTVLIDADNVPYSNIKGMMEEIAKYGTPTTKRIYADWTKQMLAVGRCFIRAHITPIQQYSYGR